MTFLLLGESFALAAACCWALGPLVAYRGVEALGTFRFSQLRYALSALLLLFLALAFGSFQGLYTHSVAYLALSGVIGVAFGEAALFQSIYYLGPRRASILFSLHAPITAFLGAAIFSESFTPGSVAGVVLTVAGVSTAIVFRSRAEHSGGRWDKTGMFRLGIGLALLAVVFQVVGALLAKDVIAGINPLTASFIRSASAAIAFLPIYAVFREKGRNIQLPALKFVFASAAISTVGGMTFLLAAFAYTEIFRAVVIASLSPVIFIIVMSALRKERFPAGAWLGTLVAVAGVVLTLGSV